jgi:molybdopterin-containing oxidoreductase family iron-sulfur binding subunit
MNRRDFLKLIGVSTGAAVLSACERAVPTKLVSAVTPRETLPGEVKLVRAPCTECPAGCGLIAKVRDGHPVKLEGDPQNPLNRGTLCMRGQASLSRLYHPGRLQTPLLKGANGEFQKITWDEAFAIINGALSKPTDDRKHVFLSGRTTGALSELVNSFCEKRGVERLPEFEVYSYSAIRQANEIVFGVPAVPFYDVKQADFLLTVDADVIETFLNPVQFALDLTAANPKWIHVEPHLSLTGINADERLVVRPGSEAWLLAHVAGALGVTAEKAAEQTGLKVEQIVALAAALKSAKKPLVIVGSENGLLAAVLGALVQAQTNAPLDFGRAWDYDHVGAPADFEKLRDRTVGVLLIHNADPVAYNPGLSATMSKAAFRIGCGDVMNVTFVACDLVLPLSHALEEAQALKPLGDTLPMTEILKKLGAEPGRAAMRKLPAPALQQDKVQEFLAGAKLEPARREPTLVVTPSIRTYDGRSDVLPLLSEMPDPLAVVTYGAWVTVSEKDAGRLGVKDGGLVEFVVAGKKLGLPARVLAGQPAGVLTVQRPFLRGMALPDGPLPVESLQATGRTTALPFLSGGMDAKGRGIVPVLEHEHEKHPAKATLYPPHEHKLYRWAMAIDLDRCIGCGACVAACYVENNVPVVGADEHRAGREMSWIRIEPFVNGTGQYEMLPMLCQQCDNAPCEPVCPVLATYHNPDGLNAQVYNRCVGTRYCSNNCPYKVRRFNWLDHPLEKPLDLMVNPDVSQRPKGVMEKCTFCIHRITTAKDLAKDEGRLVRDGELTTACAETCPAQAIVFGNILDKGSRVHQQARSERAYRVLEDLGTEPSVYYLKSRSEA